MSVTSRPRLRWTQFKEQAMRRRRKDRLRRRSPESGQFQSLSLWLQTAWCLIL